MGSRQCLFYNLEPVWLSPEEEIVSLHLGSEFYMHLSM